MEILSFIPNGTNSTIVTIMTEKTRIGNAILGKKIEINNPEIKNAIDPCRDLLNNFVSPEYLPIIAAKESDIHSINIEYIAIFSGNIASTITLPINTQDAPVKLLNSYSRIMDLKKY